MNGKNRLTDGSILCLIIIGQLYGLEKFWAFLQYFPRGKDRKLDARIKVDPRISEWLSKYQRLEDFRIEVCASQLLSSVPLRETVAFMEQNDQVI